MPDTMTELSAEESALLEADRADKTPIEPDQRPEPSAPAAPEAAKPRSDAPPERAEPAVETPAGPEHPQTVPYSALAEERSRRKELEKRERAANEQLQRLSGRMEELNRLLGPKQEQARSQPTVTEQPIEVLQDLVTWKQQREQQDQVAQQWQQFNSAMTGAVQQFEVANPDFNDAVRHLETARIAELQAIGVPDDQIRAVLQQEAVQISSLAFQQGANPAERFYRLAQQRGYQKAGEAAQGGNGSSAPTQSTQRAPNGQFVAAEKQLATVARGQQGAGRSLSGAGGGSGGELTLEALQAMSDEDFAAIKDVVWRKMWN